MNNFQIENKGNILIVDDAPDNLRLLSRMLVQQGYDVRSAISGALALRAVHTIPTDLILLDINMPKMNGFEVCEQLKQDVATCEIPVIFLSAYSNAVDKVKAFRAGGIDYITKPFQVEEVLARVENQLTLRRLQIELQQAKADALRALEREKELNRLKSEFVSMITHDFKTPLASIQGFAGLLQAAEEGLTEATKIRYFDKIDAAIEHMRQLLDNVLLISGAEVGKLQCHPTRLNLESFCRDLVESMQLSQDHNNSIRFTCASESPQANIDPMLLRQILSNLLANAIKYSPAGEVIQFDLICQDNTAQLRIQDHGIGIPQDDLCDLFQAFHRCNNVGQIRGTGLGLAVVKKCVEAHSGEIHLESQEGEGTTVTVTLPRSK
ncbi:MAG: hybrid sensor histidine kinase/response regulator [Leptolyngbyaceae cyanobacterium MO_188.B28]|nr:hybrid sensor histidine kinase/response regulator [Leptolyngbyaceae cyanobacterium MO_188.B28]